MGNTQGFQPNYSVPLKGTETSNTTTILHAASHPDQLLSEFNNESIKNCWYLFQRGRSINSGRNPCLGYRCRSDDGNIAPEFTWLSFNDVESSAIAFGSGLLNLPGCIETLEFDDEIYVPARRMRLLGIFSKNRVEWFLCEQAANAYQLTIVPLYDTLGQDALEFILEKTRMKTVVCSLECLPTLLKSIETTKYVKYIIMLLHPHETIPDELMDQMNSLKIRCIKFDEVKNHPGNLHPICPGDISSINTVCYTSGTTGNPKGVLLTHRNIVSCVASLIRGPIAHDLTLSHNEVYISYLPLAHVFERLVCSCVFTIGGSIGIYSGNASKLLEDVRCLRPTVFASVPRLFNRINDTVFQAVAKKSAISQFLFERGMASKLDVLRKSGTTTSRLWDPLVFNKTRALMGDRLRCMISGGAPLDPVIQEHMKILFCTPLIEGYGLTETFGASFLANSKDPICGHVGGVVPCNEFRLKSVPEMGCDVNVSPPRGELQIRGHATTVGYFRDAKETRAMIDSDGWLSTGDVAVLLPGGGLKIIDRRKNIFKLAQGEYVAPEKIEAVCLQAPLVSQAFIFGYSDKTSLVAILVPDGDVLKSWANKQQCFTGTESMEELCNSNQLKTAIMKEMDDLAKECGLKGFEKAKDVHINSEPFTVENGLLTPTLKIKRHQAKQMFQKEIDEMYSRMK